MGQCYTSEEAGDQQQRKLCAIAGEMVAIGWKPNSDAAFRVCRRIAFSGQRPATIALG
jgi:hypothetical protein